MINTATSQPVRVLAEDTEWPYIWLPETQIAEVEEVLQRHGIRHWARDNRISWNKGPFMGFIDLGRGTNAAVVQELLDGIP